MMAKFWTQNDKVLVDATGKPIDCEVCPCPEEAVEYDCDCVDSIPDQMRVVLSGFFNRDCDCTGIVDNSPYILDFVGQTTIHPCHAGNFCLWEYDFPSAICSYNKLEILITTTGIPAAAEIIVQLSDGNACEFPNKFQIWRSMLTDSLCEITDESIGWIVSDGTEDCYIQPGDSTPTAVVTSL